MNNKKPPFNNKLARAGVQCRDPIRARSIERARRCRNHHKHRGCPPRALPGTGNAALQHVGVRRHRRAGGACGEGRIPRAAGELPVGLSCTHGIQATASWYAQCYELSQKHFPEKNLSIKVGLKELPIQHVGAAEVDDEERGRCCGLRVSRFELLGGAQELAHSNSASAALLRELRGLANKRYDTLIAKANADSDQKHRAQL